MKVTRNDFDMPTVRKLDVDVATDRRLILEFDTESKWGTIILESFEMTEDGLDRCQMLGRVSCVLAPDEVQLLRNTFNQMR